MKLNADIMHCPFCGGNAKVSFKDYRFYGKNFIGDKRVSYRVQVICNKCRSRGKPIITKPLVNPNPYISLWGNAIETDYEKMPYKCQHQTDLFAEYVETAIDAWNERV